MKGIAFTAFLILFVAKSGWSQTNIDTSNIIRCVFPATPEFPGGLDSLRSYIKKNLRWQNSGYDDSQGRVIVTFIVETNGRLTDIRVLKGLSKEKDIAALCLMKKSPKWNPAIENGKPKRVLYTLPILFTMVAD